MSQTLSWSDIYRQNMQLANFFYALNFLPTVFFQLPTFNILSKLVDRHYNIRNYQNN